MTIGTRARLGNVTGALLLTRRADSREPSFSVGSVGSVAVCFDSLFEQTLLVGGLPAESWPGERIDDPRGGEGEFHSLIAACEASSSDRIVVAHAEEAGGCADLILALTAWPERDAVVILDSGNGAPLCAAYRREACLQMARNELAAGARSRKAFLGAIARSGGLEEVSVDRMRLADWRRSDPLPGGAH